MTRRLFDSPFGRSDGTFPWMCRWDDLQLVVWAATIEEARLEARRHAGPTVAVSARLATIAEQGE